MEGDQVLRPWKLVSLRLGREGSGGGGEDVWECEECIVGVLLVSGGLRWAIQSPSGTGRRTGLLGMWFKELMPEEEVRGGMALGDMRLSDTMVEDLSTGGGYKWRF